MSTKTSSPYFKVSELFPALTRFSYAARKQTFDFFMKTMQPSRATSVIDIGVTGDAHFREANIFEQLYPYRDQIVAVGPEEGSHLESLYPGMRFVPIQPGTPLPFQDKHFDIAFSNAVVEHVGSRRQQEEFIAEVCRVARRIFIVVPNRWFPVEHHTAVPFLHYLPKPLYRRLLAATPLRVWSREENLNSLTKRELAGLFPPGYPVQIEIMGIGFGPLRSNIVAYSTRAAPS